MARRTKDSATSSQTVDHADVITKAILNDLEDDISCDATRAAIYGVSALAAVQVLFTRYGIQRSLIDQLYRQHWSGVVEKILLD